MAPVLARCFGPGTGNALFRARYNGIPGATYTVERATALSGTWAWYTNVVAPAEDQGQGIGVFDFSENPVAHSPRLLPARLSELFAVADDASSATDQVRQTLTHAASKPPTSGPTTGTQA